MQNERSAMEDKDMFRERVRELRREVRMSQKALAAELGISQQAYAKYERGLSSPNPASLCRIAKIFGVSTDYLLGGNGRMPGLATAPVLGQVAAGQPIDAISNQEGQITLSPEQSGDGNEYFALRIHGRSMEPRMHEGDIVIVRRQEDAENGETAVVMVENESATCKKIMKSAAGLTLIPTNPTYEPMFFSCAEVEALPVRILGRVVELRAKY